MPLDLARPPLRGVRPFFVLRTVLAACPRARRLPPDLPPLGQIRFRPAQQEGQPVDSTAIVHIVFELAY